MTNRHLPLQDPQMMDGGWAILRYGKAEEDIAVDGIVDESKLS